MSDERTYWIVCDEHGAIATIQKVPMFNHACSVLSIFADEESALHVAFEITERSGITHRAAKVKDLQLTAVE